MVTSSARRHGVAEDDLLHAYRNPLYVYTNQGDLELTMHVGPATNGATMLEVGFITVLDGPSVTRIVVHGMKARQRYL